jgi:hypothetical protein
MNTYGVMSVQLHHSWPQHQMNISDQFHASVALHPRGKELPVSIRLEAVGAPDSVWTVWRGEISCICGNRIRAVQPVVHRYTDSAIPTPREYGPALFIPTIQSTILEISQLTKHVEFIHELQSLWGREVEITVAVVLFLTTVKPRFTNLIRSWRSFVNRNYFPHRN